MYNRGIGAHSSAGKSVRLKGSFVKNVDAPMSKKLSKEQWAFARVYSFLAGNPKHDQDLRENKMKGGMDGIRLAPCEGEAHTGECSLSAKEINDLREILENEDITRNDIVNVIRTLEPTLSHEYDRNLLNEAKSDIAGRTDRRAIGTTVNKLITILDRVFPSSTGSGKKGTKLERHLAEVGITSDEYLKKVRQVAKREGYNPKSIEFANDNKHKFMITAPDGTIRKFGAAGMMDFILWNVKDKSVAKARQESYLKRSGKIAGDWKEDKYSPNSLARNILW